MIDAALVRNDVESAAFWYKKSADEAHIAHGRTLAFRTKERSMVVFWHDGDSLEIILQQ